MGEKVQTVFFGLMSRFIEYFPQLLAGIALVVCGWILGWFIKRLVIHLAVILKIDHYLESSRWKAAFEKADVRYGFYNFLGNISFFVVFLIFVDFALLAWDIKVLSKILEEVMLFFPRFLVAAVIFSIGWIIARSASHALHQQLTSENIPYASLIAQYARLMMVVLSSAMSLFQLAMARDIVLIGFTTIFITLGIIAVIFSAIYGKKILLNQKESTEKTKGINGNASQI